MLQISAFASWDRLCGWVETHRYVPLANATYAMENICNLFVSVLLVEVLTARAGPFLVWYRLCLINH